MFNIEEYMKEPKEKDIETMENSKILKDKQTLEHIVKEKQK